MKVSGLLEQDERGCLCGVKDDQEGHFQGPFRYRRGEELGSLCLGGRGLINASLPLHHKDAQAVHVQGPQGHQESCHASEILTFLYNLAMNAFGLYTTTYRVVI